MPESRREQQGLPMPREGLREARHLLPLRPLPHEEQGVSEKRMHEVVIGMSMNLSFGVLLLAIAAVAFSSGCTGQPSQPGTNATGQGNNVVISGYAFSPQQLQIKAGEKVTWTNQDSAPHTVVSDSGSELSSPSLSTGQSYSHTFAAAGTYNYHCSIHKSMKGTIVVE
jgi:amicyanin